MPFRSRYYTPPSCIPARDRSTSSPACSSTATSSSPASVGNSLLSLYFKLASDFNDARRLFDGLRYRDVVSWSSMISRYIREGKSVKSVELYMEMLDAGIEPNAFTLSTMIKACSAILGWFKLGKCLHRSVVRCGFGGNEVIVAALIDMYGRNSEESVARQLFDEMLEPDSISV